MDKTYFDYLESVANKLDLIAYTYNNPQTKVLCYVMGHKNKNLEDRNLGHNMRSINAVMSKRQNFNVFIMGNTFMMAFNKNPMDNNFIDDCISKAFSDAENIDAIKQDISSGKLNMQIFVEKQSREYIISRMEEIGIKINSKNFA